MQDALHSYKIVLMIALNLLLQITAFCLIKYSWIYANHSIANIINIVTLSAFALTFIRALLWQHILKINDLMSSYLPNALVPSLLLIAGYFVFNEQITYVNVLGTCIIMAGLVLLFRSRVAT